MYRLPPALRTVCGACVVVCALLASVAVAQKPYSFDEAWRAHFFCRAAYCSGSDVQSWTCGDACSSVGAFENRTVLDNMLFGTRGLAGVDHANRQIVVAYRGSDNIQNFVENINVLQVRYDKSSSCGRWCRVHAGFLDAYNSLRQQTRDVVLQLIQENPTYEVLVTGYSLGAAIAVLAAVDLQVRLNSLEGSSALKPVSLYTFGGPRVGNSAFAKWVDALLSKGAKYRITHGLDPVVRVPALFWGYSHSTTEVFYRTDSNDSAVVCNDSPGWEDWKCSLRMLSLWVPDHMRYLGDTVFCT
ncbi:hypothetical protein CUR178_02636 [Leishmania enriettii]|uniref:Fungal lipase-type domain-containing protein n=1 Tax=Leishmania enriettii TaxID=5663 RepID=A0A836H6P5_LEIEN|nr:hypothetical protein CUR178_02624 [Leishmania enriettii]KAG5471960.1 hypothetical protein CUR178_02625 [Leishmania enriettii]KAG5471961.1 hypothetical protein CUR178_02626 [Leishmania enriettii]KAG5471962.1 hypothetical protein CUR178_02627 [Leishmania enriettii]KAG5471963.1 hypothetical protein CUR178_02628 [Leishmania enriettii]